MGDSAIFTYNLQWDSGSGGAVEADWIDLNGNPTDSLSTVFIVKDDVLGGEFYRFRVRAGNIYGYGVFSEEYEFKASQEPQQIASESISTANSGTDIVITWEAPDDNFDTITQYLIELRESDGETFTEAAECDGSD